MENEKQNQSGGKLFLSSFLVYFSVNVILGVVNAFLWRLSDFEINKGLTALLSLLPAIYFYQRYKHDFDKKKSEIKRFFIYILGSFAIPLAAYLLWAYNVPKNSELDAILGNMNSTGQQVRTSLLENKYCFDDESLENGKSSECVTNLLSIQGTFKTADKENIVKLDSYYQSNQSKLDGDTKSMVENSLKLYKSSYYSDLMSAYDRYFAIYIEWHKYFRDYVGIKGVDNMTSGEIMKARTLAQEIEDAEANLKLKTNAFNDYLQTSFDPKFIEAISAYKESLK